MSKSKNKNMYVSLHCHSSSSLLDGAIKVGDLVKRAIEYEMPAVAITDHGNMFNAVEFYLKAKEAGIKPIVGSEVYVAPGSRFEKGNAKKSKDASSHLILLCMNDVGYKNLCRLMTHAFKEGFYHKPRVDWELLEKYNEGLICSTACLGGEIPQLILKDKFDDAKRRCLEISEIFKGRFYLELQENFLKEQEIVNKALIEISDETGIPLVATNDCHYLDKAHAYAHEVLLCIQTAKTMDDPDRMRFENNEFYFKSPDEMAELFAHRPDALENTLKIAEQCNLELDMDTYHLPEYKTRGDQTLADALREQSREGLVERFAEIRLTRPEFSAEDEERYRERLEIELDTIDDMGFPGYLLIVADFINWAKDQDIPVGPGRGSAAGSLVCYAIKITDIDPMPYNLLFERFLNPERISMPDIDVDFCIRGRERVIDYCRDFYGNEQVAQIITFGTMQAKNVVRDVGRALGMPYGDFDKIAKLIPDVAKNLEDAISKESKLKKMIENDSQVAKLFDVAKSLEGLSRHASTHAAGVVITPNPLTEYLPLYVDQKSPDAQVTQFTMNYAEKIGLIKFDFLGLRNLTIIDNAIKFIRVEKAPDFDIRKIDFSDKKAYELLQSANTTGVFQLESSGMKEMLLKLKPSCFEDVIAAVALYRPGPLGSGMVDDFIDRKHGKKTIVYDFPQLEPILKDTYGVIVYQEQVMQIAQVLANYSLGAADLLRRAMGKKKPEEMAKERVKFLAGAKENKLDMKKAEAVFDLMEKFAEYGFNKSHSAAYAMISYQTAYLKAHYPVEFMAALLTEDINNTDKVIKNVNEAKAMGISVLPPDINESYSTFTVHGSDIRFGLGAIKGVGANALETIVERRDKDGNFTSLQDFCLRNDLTKVSKKVVEALIKSGAMDSLGALRAQMMVAYPTTVEVAQKFQKQQASGQGLLFDAEEVVSVKDAGCEETLPTVDEWTEKQKLAYEKETLGFYVSGHPLMRHQNAIRRFATCLIGELSEQKQTESIKVCGNVVAIKEILTKKSRERMAFVTIEDLTGSVEAVVFSHIYAKAVELLESDEALCFIADLEVQEDTPKLILRDVSLLGDMAAKMTKRVAFRFTESTLTDDRLCAVRDLVARHKGDCEAAVVVSHEAGETLLNLPHEFRVAPSDELVDDAHRVLGTDILNFE